VHNLILYLVIATALAFDFTNGFHDTANAMATSIATGAFKPRTAVSVAAVLNLAGAFLSLSVAATIASGIVTQDLVTLPVIFAGLAGAIIWNVSTWYAGIPSSSSHALIGGVVGAMLAYKGSAAVQWNGVLSKVLLPAILAIAVAGALATIATWLAFRITRGADKGPKDEGFRLAQKGSASMIALAHGTNDAQKTMGIITLALIANNTLAPSDPTPTWVIASCGIAIAGGTFIGGWRIIRTLGKGITDLESPQGFAAETSSATTILTSSYLGFPLSTTQVCTSSVVGSGLGAGVAVRWPVFGRMIVAWILTFPAALGVGALTFGIQNAIGGNVGVAVTAGLLAAVCLIVFLLSRRAPVTPANVNDDWDPTDELPTAQPADAI
jgi:PiT family inorganic phosphate transporter